MAKFVGKNLDLSNSAASSSSNGGHNAASSGSGVQSLWQRATSLRRSLGKSSTKFDHGSGHGVHSNLIGGSNKNSVAAASAGAAAAAPPSPPSPSSPPPVPQRFESLTKDKTSSRAIFAMSKNNNYSDSVLRPPPRPMSIALAAATVREEAESPPPPLPPKLFNNQSNKNTRNNDNSFASRNNVRNASFGRGQRSASSGQLGGATGQLLPDQHTARMIYLDPSKRTKTSDAELKVIQKRALLEFYLKQSKRTNSSTGSSGSAVTNSLCGTSSKNNNLGECASASASSASCSSKDSSASSANSSIDVPSQQLNSHRAKKSPPPPVATKTRTSSSAALSHVVRSAPSISLSSLCSSPISGRKSSWPEATKVVTSSSSSSSSTLSMTVAPAAIRVTSGGPVTAGQAVASSVATTKKLSSQACSQKVQLLVAESPAGPPTFHELSNVSVSSATATTSSSSPLSSMPTIVLPLPPPPPPMAEQETCDDLDMDDDAEDMELPLPPPPLPIVSSASSNLNCSGNGSTRSSSSSSASSDLKNLVSSSNVDGWLQQHVRHAVTLSMDGSDSSSDHDHVLPNVQASSVVARSLDSLASSSTATSSNCSSAYFSSSSCSAVRVHRPSPLKAEIAIQTTESLRRNSRPAVTVTANCSNLSSGANNCVLKETLTSVVTVADHRVLNSKESNNNNVILNHSQWLPNVHNGQVRGWPRHGLREVASPLAGYQIAISEPSNNNNGFSEFARSIMTGGGSSTAMPRGGDNVQRAHNDEIEALNSSLESMRLEEAALRRDMDANDSLGSQLLNKFRVAGLSSLEADKITVHCDEIDKVTRLLVSLSTRLKAIEAELEEKSRRELKNSSSSRLCLESAPNIKLPDNLEDHPELQNLISRRSKLLVQLDEAAGLRQAIERRSETIALKILPKYFDVSGGQGSADNERGCSDRSGHRGGGSEVSDFVAFTKIKSELIVEARELKDKIDATQRELKVLLDTAVAATSLAGCSKRITGSGGSSASRSPGGDLKSRSLLSLYPADHCQPHFRQPST